MKTVDIISRRRIFDNVFKIEEAQLRFERHDGSMSEPVRRLKFERGDSAAALVINSEHNTVLLAEQFRYPTLEKRGGWLIEIMAGSIEDGETPLDCVRREIREEFGIDPDRIERIEQIASFFVSPGGSSERIVLFCAVVTDVARVAPGGGVACEGEDIKVLEWPLDEFLAKLQSCELNDAKTLIAGYWLKENLPLILHRPA
jgi:ADP-ribose pyrophosphatase